MFFLFSASIRNETSPAKFRFDTAENERAKNLQNLPIRGPSATRWGWPWTSVGINFIRRKLVKLAVLIEISRRRKLVKLAILIEISRSDSSFSDFVDRYCNIRKKRWENELLRSSDRCSSQ